MTNEDVVSRIEKLNGGLASLWAVSTDWAPIEAAGLLTKPASIGRIVILDVASVARRVNLPLYDVIEKLLQLGLDAYRAERTAIRIA